MVNYKELPKMKTALPHKAGTLPSEIANFRGNNSSSSFNYCVTERPQNTPSVLRNIDNFPPGAFYSNGIKKQTKFFTAILDIVETSALQLI